MARKFSRNIEDFTCFNCGLEVKGTGYTDHCKRCLWGLHVDVNPGDRMSDCKGKLKPIRAESTRKDVVIIYECQKCKKKIRNNTGPNDDKEKLFELLH